MYDATMDGGPRPVSTETDIQLSHLMADITEEHRQLLARVQGEDLPAPQSLPPALHQLVEGRLPVHVQNELADVDGEAN